MSKPPSKLTSNFQQIAGQAQSADVMSLRKQLIQKQSEIENLKEALDEKGKLYADEKSKNQQLEERLRNVGDNIKRVNLIVDEKVQAALRDKLREFSSLQEEVKSLKVKDVAADQTIMQLTNDKKLLLDKVQGLNSDLNGYLTTPDQRDQARRLENLRAEKETESRKYNEMLKQYNDLSNDVENLIAENRVLRQMTNVPDNYGLKIEQIKMFEKDKIEDFKKLIKVLQDDNYKLEEERAKLKHALKLQSMMTKADPEVRYKNLPLTPSQIEQVDKFVISLIQGQVTSTSDQYALRRENEQLKAQLEALNSKGFEMISSQVKNILQGKNFGDNSQQLSKLIADNEELRFMIAKILENGISGGGPADSFSHHHSRTNFGSKHQVNYGQYPPPKPNNHTDGEFVDGTSFKFHNSTLSVADKDGRIGVNISTAYEHAFLQLQLQECFEIIKRKDENLKFQQVEIDSLFKRVRNYVLTQDQLYKDFVRMERAFAKKEQELREKNRQLEEQVNYDRQRVSKCEDLINSMKGGPDQNANRLIELTKQNAILDVNLLKLTRKYQSLEEQEKLLRREYHAKDSDQAEKDLQTQWRINSLKEWKARAIQQLKFQFEKLRIAVPMSEYDIVSKEVELAKLRTNDYIMRNAKLASDKANLQKKLRENMEAEVNLRSMKEAKEQALEEYDIIKKRLEAFDPVFRFENSVFAKIAKVLLRAKISPEQAFAEFDASKDGNLSRKEFVDSLAMMKLHDLSTQEIDVVWDALDVDKSGQIDYKEFSRKLEHYGVRNRSREEMIITQMIDAVSRSKVKNLSNLFELIDKTGRGFIDRQDFIDIFQSLNLKIDQTELNRFMDNFWKDKDAGIDYQGFLRIFSKYQIKMDRESKASSIPKVITDEVVRLKKKLYMDMQDAFNKTGKTLSQLFRVIDTDHSNAIGPDELLQMFRNMQFKVSQSQSQEIFDSIDFDGGGQISLPEFIADFKMVCERDVEELIREEHQKRNENQKINANSSAISKQQYEGIQSQTRIDLLHAEKKQLQRKLDTQMRILQNSESSLHFLQSQYNTIDKQLNDLTLTNYEQKERIISLETMAKNSISKNEADNINVSNENLKVELVETRAAMLSYKSMYNVIADQAKNLKLIQERKKDEHDNLVNALREMQSEGVTQERLGKLYFIIMLSRWQEASVNKRYDQVLQEVKELRGELVSTTQMCQTKEKEHQEAENLLQKYNVDREKLQQIVNSTKGGATNPNQLFELNHKIQDMSDNLTESEESLMNLRIKHREIEDLLDSAQAKAENASDLLEKLQRSRPDELSNKLVELSEKHQQIRLNELRASRLAKDLEEKQKYLSNLLKNKNEQIIMLEEKASKAEASVIKIEENFRIRENERTRKFFFVNKFEESEQVQRSNNNNLANAIQRAANMTSQNLGPRPDAGEFHKSKTVQQTAEFTAGWTKGQISHDTGDRINRLESQINDLNNQLRRKEEVIHRFEQWQIGDKYLSQDEVLKDAIDEHRQKQSKMSEKEQKEISDAAYQTIKTLQDMLDNKNSAIRAKEDQITKLRAQMNQQREIDAQTISQLRDQISITGNSTLARMQEIVSKHEVQSSVQNQKQISNKKVSEITDVKEFQRQIQDKDNLIHKLRTQLSGHSSENAFVSKKRDERLEEINQLKSELMREKQKNDVTGVQKKLDRYMKEREQQDKTIQQLNKAIDAFRTKITSYEAEKLTLTDENEISKKKEEFGQITQLKEVQILKDKLSIVEASRNKANIDVKEYKVKCAELEQVEKDLHQKLKDLQGKYDTALKSLEDERKSKVKIQIELNEYKDEQKIGGNIGGKMSYEALLQRNKELEQDNRILQCQTKTVVVYNRENGCFEYIGEPRPLDFNIEIKTVREVLDRMIIWLKTQNRLTVGPIFRSLDKQNHGDLKSDQIAKGFEKMGIILKNSEMKLLQEKLDTNLTGYLKIEPLIRELQGIKTEEFIIQPVKKLARLIDSRDFNKNSFRTLIDPTHYENMSLDIFTKAIMQLNASDFNFTNEEAEQVFRVVTNAEKVQGIQIKVTQLIDILFEAVKSTVIQRIREQLKRSGKYLIDLLVKYDNDKDGFLTYTEFENLLIELPVSIKAGIFNDILMGEMLDTGKRLKIGLDIIKWYLGGGSGPQTSIEIDLQPVRDRNSIEEVQRGKLSEAQFEVCRATARKIMNSNVQVMEVLNSKDVTKEGLLTTEDIIATITEKRISELQPSEINMLVQYCDTSERGFIVIPSFVSKINDLAAETPQESALRKFAGSIARQGINLRTTLTNAETQHSGRLDKVSFKKALKAMQIGLNDPEIETLFQCAEISPELIDTKVFTNKVDIASKAKAPTVNKNVVKPDPKSQLKEKGQKQENSVAFDSWELEKKYKKNLEALKQEIEDRNREIQIARKEVKDANERVQKKEQEYRKLETTLVDRHAKPPKQIQTESEQYHSLDEIQKLKDEIYHLQQVNQALSKTVQVDLKAELGKIVHEKESLEQKLKSALEKLRNKTNEINQIVGRPMDQIGRREEKEELRQKQIEELQKELSDSSEQHKKVLDRLFKAEERVLDLKFEKETFDLQYARLQKRISDLENYKLQSSQLSVVLKNQYQKEIDEIRNQTETLRGDSLQIKSSDTVKLRSLKSKTAAELEQMVEQLKRVVEKQKAENIALSTANAKLEALCAKGSNEPALRQKIEMLERTVHVYEMADVKTGEKDTTIKKLVFANKTLREDLETEIERFNLLQSKYKELLIKYNIASKENSKNQRSLFSMTTGAQMQKYENFLDDQGEFNPKKSRETDIPEDGDELNDSLNKINRADARY